MLLGSPAHAACSGTLNLISLEALQAYLATECLQADAYGGPLISLMAEKERARQVSTLESQLATSMMSSALG